MALAAERRHLYTLTIPLFWIYRISQVLNGNALPIASGSMLPGVKTEEIRNNATFTFFEF